MLKKGCVIKVMNEQSMNRSLKNRHLQMISLGGIIGSCYFLGAGYAIEQAGPAIILSYLFGGAIVLCVMLCLAELAVAKPILNLGLRRWLGLLAELDGLRAV